MQHVVGIAEMKVSKNPQDILVTYSLGSSLGVALYDPHARIGGLIHCMLPLAKTDAERAEQNPCMFADLGIPRLLHTLTGLGADRRRLSVRVAGAACVLDDSGLFRIGPRNYVVLRKVLWWNSLYLAAEHVGGTQARTLSLHIGTGRVMLRMGGKEFALE